MKRSNIYSLRCVECSASVWDFRETEVNLLEVRVGELHCHNCGCSYTILGGIADFRKRTPDSVTKEIISSEGTGKYIYSKLPEYYNDDILLNEPELPAGHPSFVSGERKADLFHQVFSLFPSGQGCTLVDLAAGTGWSTRYFAKKGYNAFAVDIVQGMYRGLSSADVFFAYEGIYFERVLGLMEDLPFVDHSIDCVFSINSFHHTEDLVSVFAEVSRILKPGGFGFIVEDVVGCLMLKQKKRNALYQREKHQHMDHVYTLRDYTHAIQAAGLCLELVFPDRVRRRFGKLAVMPNTTLQWLYLITARMWFAPMIFRISYV
ncbi:MAG: class I SAM-dependent methyltransferase [Chloroflexota bacterium]